MTTEKKKWYQYIRIQLLADILKEKGKYSQGRVYLLISILTYYLTLGILTHSGIKKGSEIDLATFNNIIDALQWSMGLFAGYVFGGKGIEALKTIMGKSDTPKTEGTNV